MRAGGSGDRGYTLTELAVVMLIMGVVAVAAAPMLSRGSERKLHIAAEDVADALRYARSEAIRTGLVHGVRVDDDGKRFALFELDTSVDPFEERYTVFDPVTKGAYDVNLHEGSWTAGTKVTGHLLSGDIGTPVSPAVAFNFEGQPLDPFDLAPVSAGGIALSNGDASIAVVVEPTTGRINVGPVRASVENYLDLFPPPLIP